MNDEPFSGTRETYCRVLDPLCIAPISHVERMRGVDSDKAVMLSSAPTKHRRLYPAGPHGNGFRRNSPLG